MLATIWNFAKTILGGVVKLLAKPLIWLSGKLGLAGTGAALATATAVGSVATEVATETAVETAVEAVAETVIETGAEEVIGEFICGLFGSL